MLDPRQIAYDVVDATLEKGLAQGHQQDSWRVEPRSMHLMKGSRHGSTAYLLIAHPEFCQDKETALDHAKQMLTRAAMAVCQLME